jgi:AP-3 complex subunit beta
MGYIPLPEFPRTAPDSSVRDVEDDSWGKPASGSKKKKKEKGFYDDSDEESSSGSDFYSSISGTDESGSEDSETDSEGKWI